jgi:tetratricopeptide (TPR) repeat protein
MDPAEERSPLETLRGEWESMCVLLGEEDPETLEIAMELGRAYRQAGAPRQARTLLESVVASRQKTLGVAHLKTIQAETLLSFALADLGELKRSRLIQKDVLERCDEQFGRRSEQSIAVALNLANTYRALKQYPEEGPLRTRVLEYRTSLFGERHIETIKSLADMAVLKRNQGEFQTAVILDHAILENVPRSQVSARELLSFKFNMVSDLIRLKKWSEATEMFDEAYEEAAIHLSPDDSLRRSADRYKSKLRYMGEADAKTRSRRERRQSRD